MKPEFLDLAAVADILDVDRQTIIQYRSDSRHGRRYGHHPFPIPDQIFGRSPVWLPSRRKEIEQWADLRPGRGRRPKLQDEGA
jgi:hypothetical protein